MLRESSVQCPGPGAGFKSKGQVRSRFDCENVNTRSISKIILPIQVGKFEAMQDSATDNSIHL